MGKSRRSAMIVALCASGVFGVGASGADALSISGGSYLGQATSVHTSTIAEFYTVECPAQDTTLSGFADDSDTTEFTAYYGGEDACNYFGFPVTTAVAGGWELKVLSGPDGSGYYYGSVTIPTGSTVTSSISIIGCTKVISGPQAFNHGAGRNLIRFRNVASPTGIEIEATSNGISYAAAGCPYSGGSDGAYSTNGVLSIPGVTVS